MHGQTSRFIILNETNRSKWAELVGNAINQTIKYAAFCPMFSFHTRVSCDCSWTFPNLFTILNQVLFISWQTSAMTKQQIVPVSFNVLNLNRFILRSPPWEIQVLKFVVAAAAAQSFHCKRSASLWNQGSGEEVCEPWARTKDQMSFLLFFLHVQTRHWSRRGSPRIVPASSSPITCRATSSSTVLLDSWSPTTITSSLTTIPLITCSLEANPLVWTLSGLMLVIIVVTGLLNLAGWTRINRQS